MGHFHLIVFTLLWTLVWVAPLPRLSRRVELVAGLIPFAAFGLRVFAGFFAGVPADDATRAAVAPLVDWVGGRAGWPTYQVVLDTTVAIGLAWLAVAFDIPRRSRVATAWIMPAAAAASIASQELAGRPLEDLLAARLPAAALAALLGGCIAAVVAWTPGDAAASVRRRAALVAVATTAAAGAIGTAALALVGPVSSERAAAAVSTAALFTGAAAGLAAFFACNFARPRSRWLFALAVGVATGAALAAAAG